MDLKAARRRFCQRLGYGFRDPDLLEQALTHRSAHRKHNERLEFLGDAVLGFLIGEQLYQKFPEASEGQMTRLRASLVKGETLSKIALELELGDILNLGSGELKSGGFRRASILADALEAVIGAIYLDGGLEVTRERILALYQSRLSELSLNKVRKDPKTRLQELLQGRKLALPVYEVVAVEGESHNQHFSVTCQVPDTDYSARGEGRSRRAAEQMAAAAIMEMFDGA